MSFFGKPLMEGYDSHHVFVKAKKFTPVLHRHDAVADEIVFDGIERILPRYIISFRRKHTRLMLLIQEGERSVPSSLKQAICKSVATAGHNVEICSSMESALDETEKATSSENANSEETVRFAISGSRTASFLALLRERAPHLPVMVISGMLEFDRHVGYAQQSDLHCNIVTYAPSDVVMFADASTRDLVDRSSDTVRLISIQTKSCSHPIAAAASRLHHWGWSNLIVVLMLNRNCKGIVFNFGANRLRFHELNTSPQTAFLKSDKSFS